MFKANLNKEEIINNIDYILYSNKVINNFSLSKNGNNKYSIIVYNEVKKTVKKKTKKTKKTKKK